MLRSTNFCEIAEAPLGALGSIMGETLGRGGARQIWEQRLGGDTRPWGRH